MPAITLKIPKRLERVEIIRADDFVIEDPLFDVDEEIEEEEPIEEIPTEPPPPEPVVIYQEFVVPLNRPPVSVKIPETPPESMLVEEVKKEVQAAYDKGYADGNDYAKSIYLDEIDLYRERLSRFESMAKELRNQYFGEIKNLEQAVLSLGVTIAEQILAYEISVDSNPFIAQLKKALRSAGEDAIFAIRMHPDNVAVFEDVKISTDGRSADLDRVRVVRDASLDKMSCVLTTSTGVIDATTPAQLELIRKALAPINAQSTLEEPAFIDGLIDDRAPTEP